MSMEMTRDALARLVKQQPLPVADILPGLRSSDVWVRCYASEMLIAARAEPEAVATCLLEELGRATEPSTLYDDRHHEIFDAASAAQFDWLRTQWPWFVGGLMAMGASARPSRHPGDGGQAGRRGRRAGCAARIGTPYVG